MDRRHRQPAWTRARIAARRTVQEKGRSTPIMSDRRGSLLGWAAVLITAGVGLLLFNFGLLSAYEPLAQYIVAGLFAAAGLFFLLTYFWQRDDWWRLMPGWTLLALGVMVFLALREDLDRQLIAAVLFVGLALAFAHIYLVDRATHWWAIIPGGFMLVLAAVISLSTTVARIETLGTVLFVGMGLVFVVLYLLAGRRRHWWALIPGGVLVLFGLVIYTVDNAVQIALLRWWPTVLVILGAILAFTGASLPPSSTRDRMSVNVAPQPPDNLPPGQERLGDYRTPAPGASVVELPDPDDRR